MDNQKVLTTFIKESLDLENNMVMDLKERNNFNMLDNLKMELEMGEVL